MNIIENFNISLSVVLYNTAIEDVNKLLESFKLIKSDYTLYIVDNSPNDSLKVFFKSRNNTTYIHNPTNPGFGPSHNIAIDKAIKNKYKYHFIVNPDVYFLEDVVTPMVDYIQKDVNLGMMMPKILNLDGTVQYLPKLLPSPFSIVMRKFKKPAFLYNKFIEKYEMRNIPQDVIYNTPILSGCFTLFRVAALKEIGLYDDRFFMYFEDWDISRRMHKKYQTLYFPQVAIYHGYESGANKSKTLFKIFINSAIEYFNKWGWFFDKERKLINKETLNQFK